MASLQLYVQKMLADMQASMSSMQSEMSTLGGKIDAQTILMNQQVSDLGDILAMTATTATTVNITSGDDEAFLLKSIDAELVDFYSRLSVKKLKVMASGVLKLVYSVYIKNVQGTTQTQSLTYSINGAADVTIISQITAYNETATFTGTKGISINSGDTLEIFLNSPHGKCQHLAPMTLNYSYMNFIDMGVLSVI